MIYRRHPAPGPEIFRKTAEREAEGAFYLEIADGKINVEPYEYYDRDVLFTCSAKTLRNMATGKLDPVLAFTIQKLKVEGDFDKALRFKEVIDRNKA